MNKIKNIRQGEVVLLSSDDIPPTVTEYNTVNELIEGEDLKYLKWQM